MAGAERWRPGEKKPAIPTAAWNRFADVADAFQTPDPQPPTPAFVLPALVIPTIDVPSFGCLGIGRPSPNPLGGLTTADAVVDEGSSTGDIAVRDAVVSHRGSWAEPDAPTSASRVNPGDRTEGETIALVYDPNDDSWSEVGSGSAGVQHRRMRFLGVPPAEEHATAFGIVQKGTRAGEAVQVVVSGLTWALINVTDEAHGHAVPPANADSGEDLENPRLAMESAAAGSKIAWKEPGLGLRYGLVLLGGGGGGSAQAGQRVMVYDSAIKAPFRSGRAVFSPVKYLPCIQSGGTVTVETSGPIQYALPISTMAITLDSDGCCGGAGNSDLGRARLDFPVAADNRIFAGSPEETALVLSGTVNPTSTVDLTLSQIDGSNSRTQTGIVPNQETGEWVAAAIDLTSSSPDPAYTRGLLRVSLVETLANDTTTLPAVRYAIAYETTDNSASQGIPNRPPAPELLTDAGGDVDTSNRTSDQTPTFRMTYPADAPQPDAIGPTWRLIRDGAIVGSGANVAYQDVKQVEHTLATTPYGDHVLQHGLYVDGASASIQYLSGPSDPLYVTINENADDPAPADTRVMGRPALLMTLEGGAKALLYDGCPYEVSEEERAKLASIATITAQAEGAFTTSTDPIPISDWVVVTNETGQPDPPIPSPAQIDQPETPVEGQDNALLTIEGSWDGTAWTFTLVSVGAPVE